MLDAIRAAPSRPLAVLIGPAAMKTREVLTDGLEVDSALAKPIDLQETRDLIDRCIRARLPKRVLIVDDSSTVRSVIRKVLQASRFKLEAEEAEDGSVAIELAKKQRFDIVFLDCQMPGIDGFAALGELKTRASGHEGGDDDRNARRPDRGSRPRRAAPRISSTSRSSPRTSTPC